MSKESIRPKSLVAKLFSFGSQCLSKLLLSTLVALIVLSTAEAAGPLRVNSANPRYFFDSNETPVYLAGTYPAHEQIELSAKDFSVYLDFLQQHKHNFTRLWAWEQTPLTAKVALLTVPYERTGPGQALDGGTKFDLGRFNQAYFDQLRARVAQAAQRGIYVSVVLFQSLNAQSTTKPINNPWRANPFNRDNNVNRIDGDTNRDGLGDEAFTLAIPAITSHQQAYIRKVVDTLNDLDNVLYEISGDSLLGSSAWQYDIIKYLKSYQATKVNQHPVGIGHLSGTNTDVAFNSPADWIAFHGADLNPPVATGGKVLFLEVNPGLLGGGSSYQSVWKSFARGFNVINKELDSLPPGVSESLHAAITQSLAYAQFLNLSAMTPSDVACPSGYCLVKPGAEYLVYLPSGGRLSVDLSAARQNFLVNWFDPKTGKTVAAKTVAGGGQITLTSPFTGESVLHLLAQTQASSQVSATSTPSGTASGATLSTTSSPPVTSPSTTQSATGAGLIATIVSTPTIAPNGAAFAGSVSVSLAVATSGATIYYTTDGSSPTQTSKKYSGPITLSTDALVKAKAFKTNAMPSPETRAWFAKTSRISSVPGGSNLVGYWNFDEATGTTAADSSGNRNTGTLVNGPVRTKGIVGNALSFDGVNDNVTVLDSNSLDLTSGFTLSAWVNPTVAQSNFTAVISKNSASDHVYFLYASSWRGYCGDTGPLAGANLSRVQRVICSSSGLPLNTWSHLTSTYDGANLNFYVNGALTQSVPFTGTIEVGTGTFQIGASHFGEYFKGLIDEVRIYNRALTNTEIHALHQQTGATVSTPPLIAQSVATPTITPNGGSFTNSASVALATTTSGAAIYYTTNGSSPTQSSTLYSGPISLTNSAAVKAKAFKTGSNASAEVNATFAISSTTSNATWTYCGREGDQCNFSGTKQVRYGDRGYYAYRTVANGIACNNEVFGDPLVGFGKTCEYSNSTTTQSTSTTTSSSTTTLWTFCALEGSPCNFSGTKEVRYGANNAYVSQSFTGGVYCGNSVFGDPVVGAGKVCEYRDISSISGLPFDFSISNSGNQSVSAGSSATSSIRATLISGTSQAVSFTVSGLPSGASGSFSSASCTLTCSTVLNISTSGSTPAGSYPISVTSAGGGLKRSTVFTLSVSLALIVATPTITPNGGTFSSSVSVSMQSATSGGSTYYTTDGSTPTQSSTLYTGTMTLTSNTTIKAAAFKSGSNPSAVAAASFTNSGTNTVTGIGRVYYVATNGSDSNSCSAARSTSTPKRNIMGANGGIACLTAGAGDRLEIRSGTYNESLNTNSQTFPSGTSYVNAATIAAFSGETVTIRQINIVQSHQYIIFERLIVDGRLCSQCNEIIGVGGTANHIRLVDIEGKNNNWGQIAEINQSAHHNEFIRPKFHTVTGVNPSTNPSGGYCIYNKGYDNLVEYGDFYGCIGYGIHNYSANPGQRPDRNIYRFNKIHGIVGGGTLSAGVGILLGTGDNNQAYGNLIYDNTGDGVQISNGATNSKLFNNTIVNNNTSGRSYGGVVWGTGSGTIIKNNILYQNRVADFADSNGVQIPTFRNNLCTSAGIGCAQAGNPLFINLTNKNYELQTGSAAIDRGAALTEVPPHDMNGTPRPRGTGWDIGAYER